MLTFIVDPSELENRFKVIVRRRVYNESSSRKQIFLRNALFGWSDIPWGQKEYDASKLAVNSLPYRKNVVFNR